MEEKHSLAFLDVLIKRDGGKLTTTVYSKKTHMDMYINYSSHHHPNTKSGVISCLRVRTQRVCDTDQLEQEMQHQEEAFKRNGYPERIIRRALYPKKRPAPHVTQHHHTHQRAVQKRDKNNANAVHTELMGHTINWKGAHNLDGEPMLKLRKMPSKGMDTQRE